MDWMVLGLLALGITLVTVFFGGTPRWSYAIGLPPLCLAGLLWQIRSRVESPSVRESSLVWLLAAVLGYWWLRGCLSPVRAAAWHEIVLLGAAAIVMLTLLGVLAEGRSRRWRLWLGYLFLLVIGICLYALVLQVRGDMHVLWRIRPQYGMRASGTFICPNHFANLLQISICMMLAVILTRAAGGWLRIVSTYGVGVGLICLALTLSRSGWLGLAIGILVLAFLLGARRSPVWAATAAVISLLLLVAAAAVVLWLSSAARQRWMMAAPAAGDPAVAVRLHLWRDTLAMVRQAPVFGHGIASFRWLYEHYKSHNLQNFFRYTHNEYLQTLAEAGAVGVALVILAVGAIVVRLWRIAFKGDRSRDANLALGAIAALAACAVHAVFDFNFHIPALLLMLASVFAVPLAMARRTSYSSGRDTRSHGLLVVSRFLVWMLVVLVLAQCARTSSDYLLTLRGEHLRNQLRPADSRSWYRAALSINAADWRPYGGLAHSYRTEAFWAYDAELREQAGQEALEWYDRALRRNPYDSDLITGKARTLQILGRTDEATALLQRAVNFAPRDRDLLIELGLVLRLSGRLPEALEVFSKALELDPKSSIARANVRLLQRKIAR